MNHHAVRVSRPYADISGVVQAWSLKSNRLVVYEHDADEEVNRTHCHFAIYGCDVLAEQLKRIFKEIYITEDKGNALWAFKEATPIFFDSNPNIIINGNPSDKSECLCMPYDERVKHLKYLSYMTKGILAPKFVKNISEDILEEAKSLWELKTPDEASAKPKAKDEKRDYWTFLEKVRADAVKHDYYSQKLNNDCELVFTVDKHKLYKLLLKHMNQEKMVMEINQMTRMMATLLRDDAIHGEEIKKQVFRRLFSD